MGTSIYFWIGFHLFVFIMLALDLGVFHKHSHKVPVKEAIIWSCIWITLALLFDLFIYLDKDFGPVKAMEFLTGYVIEYSLSVDNIFVFILISVSYTHLRAHETRHDLVCRLLLE